MMFPTTVLSVLAVSAAAENTSSGNRGLRKSSTPWTAIAVVSGTAVTGLGLGWVIGYFSHQAIAGSGGCGAGIVCTGCKVDFYQTGDAPVASTASPPVTPADERSCAACASDKFLAANDFVAKATTCAERVCVSGGKASLTDGKTCKCKGSTPGTCTKALPNCASTGVCSLTLQLHR